MCYVITLATPLLITHSSKAPYTYPVRVRESEDNFISICNFLSLNQTLCSIKIFFFWFLFVVCFVFLLEPFFFMVLPSIYQLFPAPYRFLAVFLSLSLAQLCQLCRWYLMLQYICLWKNKGIPWAGSERRVWGEKRMNGSFGEEKWERECV